jgi:hypothetical protein
MSDRRKKWAMSVMRRALPTDCDVRISRDFFEQSDGSARLSDAGQRVCPLLTQSGHRQPASFRCDAQPHIDFSTLIVFVELVSPEETVREHNRGRKAVDEGRSRAHSNTGRRECFDNNTNFFTSVA